MPHAERPRGYQLAYFLLRERPAPGMPSRRGGGRQRAADRVLRLTPWLRSMCYYANEVSATPDGTGYCVVDIVGSMTYPCQDALGEPTAL
jgi:hypothetical protein